MSFKDHFSTIATSYAAYRPHYPPELFSFLAQACSAHERAVDLGTGNGQAARGLAAHFQEVIATDASAGQIAAAHALDRIQYRVSPAERIPLEAGSVDLVTAAAAAHWFDHAAVNEEVRRVLKPGGIVAFWTYWKASVSPAVDAVLERFQFTLVGPYWPPERVLVNSAYRDLPFPFEELKVPLLEVSAAWDLDHFLGYLRTWSAVQRYLQEVGRDPVELVSADLSLAWGAGERTVRWPLAMRIGQV